MKNENGDMKISISIMEVKCEVCDFSFIKLNFSSLQKLKNFEF